ncbi:hypothetical protein [Caballeronia sp. PC1]|uniref:hypothetical protein n=1 Tax=unclassified Caballeronia TaxID=2646786 RepID=UPI00045EEDF5|nr:glycerophosphoryl diester phosphodiesterase [Burkholderia sp. RPE67]
MQSFEPGSLQYMRTHGLNTKIVQLIDGYDVDYRTGAVIYNEITDSRPFDWTVAGDPRWFDAMLTPAGLAQIKTYADGIGPWKPQIVPLKISPFPSTNPDGTPFAGSTAQAATQAPTNLIGDAHKAGQARLRYKFVDGGKARRGKQQRDSGLRAGGFCVFVVKLQGDK